MPEKKPTRLRALERQTNILRSVADGFTKRSKESKAIRMAALALVFASLEHPDEFKAFDGPPTAEQRSHLVKLGLAWSSPP